MPFGINIFGGKNNEKTRLRQEIEKLQTELDQKSKDIPKLNLKRPQDMNTLERDESGLYKIVCPYCLEKFEIADLLYRANVVGDYTGNVLEGKSFGLEEDQAFQEYWENIGANTQEVNRPHLLNPEPAAGEIQSVTLEKKDELGRIGRETLPYDEQTREAMKQWRVIHMTDRYGHQTDVRVCPHCHTELPNDMGFVPNYIFSLIGNTSCGKSVYLLRLVKTLIEEGNFMARQFTCQSVNDEKELEYKKTTQAKEVFSSGENGKTMLEATPVGFIRPEIIRLINMETNEKIYLTLFDYPGEAIWQSTENTFFRNLSQKNFDNSNGWIFLFDAGTLPFVNEHLNEKLRQVDLQKAEVEQRATPKEIFNQVHDIYAYGGYFVKPIAFVLSKSDMIQSCLGDLQGHFVEHEPRFLCNPQPHGKVDMRDLYQVDQELRSLLATTGVVENGDLFCQKNCAWFAVSSTTVPLEEGRIPTGAVPAGLRDTDPLEWLLYRCGVFEGELEPEDPLAGKITDWATSFQIPDMRTYKEKIQECEGLYQQIQEEQEKLRKLGG